jgi:undecaprenyl-diphosphatase
VNPVQILQAFILGIVQGITEFLPISSTAHLVIFTKVLKWSEVGEKYFVDAIQFGSVVAVLMYFWADITKILSGGIKAFQQKDWQREEWKLLVGIAVGACPALAAGLVIKLLTKAGVLSKTALEAALLIAIASIVMALLLGLAEKIGSRKRGFSELSIKDGILVGLGQMLAVIPGVSRSGSTLTTGLFLGLERQTAARFSFLLGLPTLAIATLVQFTEIFEHPNLLPAMLVGMLSTFIFSYLSIAFLLKFLQRHSNWVFVWYRLGFGAMLLLGIWLKQIDAF